MHPIHRAVAFALVGGAVVVALPAQAQDETYFNAPPPPPPVAESPYTISGGTTYRARLGPQVGLRVAYGGGTGVVYEGLEVSNASVGALPMTLDLGWRFLPMLYVGLYGQFAPVFTRENSVSCPAGFDCWAHDWRFGAEADFHFLPHSRLDPYVGLGTGYEILENNVHGTAPVPTPAGPVPGNVSVNTTDTGYEFLNVTLGFDWRIDSVVGVGPFITGTLGRYATHEGTQTTVVDGMVVQTGEVPSVSHGMHELAQVGVRGTFNP
jgi:hypothetical protein